MSQRWGSDVEAWPPVRLVRAASVMVRGGGAVVPRDVLLPDVRLDGPGIELLARLGGAEPVGVAACLAAIAGDDDTTRLALAELLHELDKRALVTDAPAPAVASASTAGVGGGEGAQSSALAVGEAIDPSEVLTVGVPWLFRVDGGRFVTYAYDGTLLLDLSVAEMALLSEIARGPRPFAASLEAHRAGLLQPLDDAAAAATVARLLSVRAVFREADNPSIDHEQEAFRKAFRAGGHTRALLAADLKEHFDAAQARGAERGRPFVPVVSINTQLVMPLAFGMIISAAKVHDGGALLDDYVFLPSVFMNEDHLRPSIEAGGVFLFSDYVWSHAENLAHSRTIKAMNPRTVVVHGGPDAPKYQGDVEAYFEQNPFVDVVVHGEGEATFPELLAALAPSFRAGAVDLEALADVPGLSYRGRHGVVRTADRDRIEDINIIPSPYLTGLYDAMSGGAITVAMLETNRGCPYSCTFCDWGSATASRIRKFDLDRVFGELEWLAKNQVERVFVVDANFGIMERDVDIARHVAHLHRTYGYPQVFSTNYAKNTVKHLREIVAELADAGVVTEGLLSLQSMDADTLKAVKRSNIKVEKYDALASEFREARLPLMVDLMIGLPGSTTGSLQNDFQECINREVNAKVFQTEVLINSPMNEPSYRDEYRIVTERADGAPAARVPTIGTAGAGRALVVSSSSFTRADYDEMLELRGAFRIVENFATLRLVARFFHHETGRREVDFIESLRHAGRHEADRYPRISIAVRSLPQLMVPPVSWPALIDEVRDLLVNRWRVEPSTALDAVLKAQYSVLPDKDRAFPFRVDLPHDVGAWYGDILAAKDAGHVEDWTTVVQPLATYAPTSFEVTDPTGVCETALGFAIDASPYLDWELSSPVARHAAGHQTTLATATS